MSNAIKFFFYSMGIQGLLPLLRKQCPQAFQIIHDLSSFKNKKIAMDIAILMYKIVWSNAQKSSSSVEEHNQKQSIESICKKIHDMHLDAQELDIQLIWVFDGVDASEDKEEEREDRKCKRQRTEELAENHIRYLGIEKQMMNEAMLDVDEMKKKIQNQVEIIKTQLNQVQKNTVDHDEVSHEMTKLNDIKKRFDQYEDSMQLIQRMEEIEKKQKQHETRKMHVVTFQIYEALKIYFQENKISFVIAKGEAERACAWMVKSGMVDAAASDDSDILGHGCPFVLRNFTKFENCEIELWNFTKILEQLNLTYDSFVEMCILCGTDFCDNLQGLGPANALKMIKIYKNLNTMQSSAAFAKFKKVKNYDHVTQRWERAIARIAMKNTNENELKETFIF